TAAFILELTSMSVASGFRWGHRAIAPERWPQPTLPTNARRRAPALTGGGRASRAAVNGRTVALPLGPMPLLGSRDAPEIGAHERLQRQADRRPRWCGFPGLPLVR